MSNRLEGAGLWKDEERGIRRSLSFSAKRKAGVASEQGRHCHRSLSGFCGALSYQIGEAGGDTTAETSSCRFFFYQG